MTVAVRAINFAEWRNWTEVRLGHLDPAQGGVYLFAHCESAEPPETATLDRLPLQVVYVGDAKNLNRRPLNRVHHRIARYRELFGDPKKTLFVTVAPLDETGCADAHVQRAYSFHTEALLVWNYTNAHGHPPAMHYKDKGTRPPWVNSVVRRLRLGDLASRSQSSARSHHR